MPKIILGFVGTYCSGNGAAADCLVKNHDFFYTSTSDEIREELRKQNQEITRKALQKTAGDLREAYGPTILTERVWEKIKKARKERVLVTSIRGIEEVKFLRQKPNFYLISFSVKPKIRFKRMLERKREKDPTTWEEFLKSEERDKKGDGRSIKACLKTADYKIKNNGTPEAFLKRIEALLVKINKEKRLAFKAKSDIITTSFRGSSMVERSAVKKAACYRKVV